MTKNVRIGIIRARHSAAAPYIPDQACISMLMVDDFSVFRYWRNTTRGFLDFIDSPLFPWVDITLGADTSRSAQANAAVAALRARFPSNDPLAGLDGLILLTLPGTVSIPNPKAGQPGQPATVTVGIDGGRTNVAGLPIAVIPVMPGDHTFMCHELGHVLGFERGHDHAQELEFEATAQALLDWAAGRPLDRPMPLAEAMARYRTLIADPEQGMGRAARSGWDAFAREAPASGESACESSSD